MSDAKLLFQQVKVSSCNCCTKALEPKYHDMHCRYKLICELEKQSQLDLEQANKDIQVLAEALDRAAFAVSASRTTGRSDLADEWQELANKYKDL